MSVFDEPYTHMVPPLGIEPEIQPLVDAIRSHPLLGVNLAYTGLGEGPSRVGIITRKGMKGTRFLINILNRVQRSTNCLLDVRLNWDQEVADACDFERFPDSTVWELTINDWETEPGEILGEWMWMSPDDLEELAMLFRLALSGKALPELESEEAEVEEKPAPVKMSSEVEKRLKQWPELKPLQARLLEMGGSTVALLPDCHIKKILSRGQVFDISDIKIALGEPRACHENTGKLFLRDPSKQIVTGWALSDDGCWRQHSWGLSGKTVMETTEARTKYFGFVMTDLEAIEFAFGNVKDMVTVLEERERNPKIMDLLQKFTQTSTMAKLAAAQDVPAHLRN